MQNGEYGVQSAERSPSCFLHSAFCILHSAFCILHSLMSCVFCTDIARSGDVVHESAHAWVVLHEDWAVPGHAMIVSRRHVQNMSDLSDHEWEYFSRIDRKSTRLNSSHGYISYAV